MTDKQRLIDADKLLKWMFNREESMRKGSGGRSVFYQSLYSSINDGDFDPDPPRQPDIKLWSKVKHKHHPSWGIGIFQEFSKKKDKALILWPDRKGMFGDRVIGYCQVEKLQKVEGEES
ncbi:hypothetical protein AAIH69_13675 [Paenibacillus sp. MABNS29]|uniref:hypothetical protein n=1 Tax=Paenibacillus sp. MABNS29 TaxID=3142627 RepID=UPI003D299E3B